MSTLTNFHPLVKMARLNSDMELMLNRYQALRPTYRAKVRTIVRLMVEIQDLERKIIELKDLVFRKNRTVTRLTSQALNNIND